MAAISSFLPAGQAFRPRPSPSAQSYAHNKTAQFFTPFASNPKPMVRVLVRRLPLDISVESLRSMVVWCKEEPNVELLPNEKSEDEGFRSALLYFQSLNAALEVKNLLDGKPDIIHGTDLVVEILPHSPPTTAGRSTVEPVTHTAATSPVATSAFGRFAGFQGFDNNLSPTSRGAFPANCWRGTQEIFSPQSPIGNHLSERHRISGKTLISNDFGDDEETSDLLKDPVAYAESGATSQRRATAPQIPIRRMSNLSNVNHPQNSVSRPPYMPSQGFLGNNRVPHYPIINPADQNPPCNTLYVGNIPMDTQEDELKAMFSKQRGYKRHCFRTKQNGPMCFVEFEDISFATKALHDLHGRNLQRSFKGGIRLSFSKNPLGVRSGQAPGQASHHAMGNMHGVMAGGANGFFAHGPPPGLSAPPGLGNNRGNYHVASGMNTGGSWMNTGGPWTNTGGSWMNTGGSFNTGGHRPSGPWNGFPGRSNNPWNNPINPRFAGIAPNPRYYFGG
ncbi:hypothetical protein E4U42_000473 [Claviceps africana]|uniref:RRM domain-containing protein n=1 Tax=Claviceps africana TaxID=83212 RepID=A0A8K0IZY8_9HYPO|nr:hypothetical protein E4U42_000473 [Claviceps africana]